MYNRDGISARVIFPSLLVGNVTRAVYNLACAVLKAKLCTPWNVKIGTGALLLICGKTTQPILNRIFLPEALILPLQRLFSLKDSRSSFSSRNHGVYARDQW